MQNTLLPAVFGTMAVLISVPLFYYGMKGMGVNGIALALSLSAFIQVFILYALWNKRSRNVYSRDVYLFFVKICLLSAMMGVLLEWFKRKFLVGFDVNAFSGSVLMVVFLSALFAAVFVSAGYIFRIKEITDIADRLAGRLKNITLF